MTPESRARMQAVLRAAVGRAMLPDASVDHPGSLPLSDPPADLLARFTAELTTLGGAVHHAAGADGVVALLLQICGARERRVLMWDEAGLPIANLPTALVRAGISIDTQTEGDLESRDRRGELAAATIGLTGADALLAETGSVVVVSGPGRGRLASLLPPVHVALVTRALLTDSLPSLLARRPDLVTRGANFVCITGPSRTADIEHTLSRGVHGPGEVHVVFVD
jgi:L-lactate dehydrogenase complex protein LldG